MIPPGHCQKSLILFGLIYIELMLIYRLPAPLLDFPAFRVSYTKNFIEQSIHEQDRTVSE